MFLENEVNEWKVMVVEMPRLDQKEATTEVVAVAVRQMAAWDPEDMIVIDENYSRPCMDQERYQLPQFLQKKAQKHHCMPDCDDQIELVTLATHPDYQRRGAGRALVGWGMLEANLLGPNLAITVLANKVGRGFFERLGFWELEGLIDGHEGIAVLWLMVYDPAVIGIKEF